MSEKTNPSATYTPGQVSEMLGIPGSSLRRYSSDFAGHLSEYARRKGKKRRYTDTDVLIIRRLRVLLSQHKSREEIDQLLQVVDDNEPENSALALLPTIAAEFESLRAQLAAMRDEMQQAKETQVELQAKIDQLQAEIERQRLPWYRRLFGGGDES